MTDMAMEPVTYSRKPMDSINRKIFNILQVPLIIPQAIRAILELGAEAFVAKSYKTSAKYFKNAIDSMTVIDQKTQDVSIILTKYMLCMCWLESTDAKDLLDALKILEELERNYGYTYPMLYYAVGKAYFKLYRFSKADEILKKGFAILNGNIEVVEYKIPGTDILIHESSKDRLVAALVTLNDQCSSWHRPDAMCCMPDCSSHSQNESADKNIFFGSPTFNGMVQVSCNNTSSMCTVSFHAACWKAKKENLCSLGKLSDRDLLNRECFTPNCEDQGVRCTIKKIEIFDENAKVKATIESRAEELVKHTKVQPPPPKGAIRKQQHQQQPKVKVTTNEPRPQIERNPRPSNIPHDIHKVDETEDDDDLHDEQALRSGIEQLIELRATNFGIKDETIWRPNLSMYGNEFMLATADALPDPDFSDEGPDEAELKDFCFSYFYTIISKSGPVKLDALPEKWQEAQKLIDKNCEFILKHYLDITEFLLQSIKFAVVGEYICVAEKLPEAYDLAKRDACEILRFFMDADIDQRSNSSSVDDDALFNDIVNQEKNNNSLPYSSISEDSKAGTEYLKEAFDESAYTDKKTNEPSLDGPDSSKIGVPLQYATPNRKRKSLPESGILAQINGHTMGFASYTAKPVAPHENVEKKKPIVPSPELSELPVAKVVTPVKKFAEKRPDSSESVTNEVSNLIEKKMPIATKENDKRNGSLPKATNGVNHVQLNISSKPQVSVEKITKESKSANDIDAYKASPMKVHGVLISNVGQPVKRPNQTISPSPISENGLRNSDKSSDNHTRPEAKNEESLVGELLEEVQRLSNKLSISEQRTAQLESEVKQTKKTHVAERIKLLQKILQGQYAYNQSLTIRKLEECRKNFEIISGIQSILINSIGRGLPITGIEHKKVMAEIEKISQNYETKFWEQNDKLESSTELENITEVNLQLPDTMPNLPAIELLDVIQSAFGLYGMYQMQDFQRMQYGPNPLARNPPRFGGPQFPPHYNHLNPRLGYPPNFLPNLPPTPHVRIPPPPHVTLSMQNDLIPPRPAPVTLPQNVPQSSQQNIPLGRLQQPNALAFVPTGSSASVQQNVFLPADPSSIGSSSSVRPSSLLPNASKVSQQQSNISIPELMKIDTSQQQNRQKCEGSSSENNQQGNVGALAKSNVQVLAQQRDTSNKHSSVNSRFNDNSQDHFDMRIVENVTSSDTYANPKTMNESGKTDYSSAPPKEIKARKKNYHSMDKLVQILRSRYVGVLELDLIKSVEFVRKHHNNSLSRIPMTQIIREADRDIMNRQQKQLCGYEKRPFFTTSNSSWCTPDNERKRETSTFSANSAKPHSLTSKKKWEPVVIPNDTWQKETPESECAICFETMLHTAESYTLQCKHTFHKTCIKHWYEQSQSCPTCRVHSTIDDEYPPLPLG